ncbi:MAG: helix-turn-helix transcriptional regulator [Halobacteriota archaeon]
MKSYELFTELASENRLSILHALKEGEMKFTKLADGIDMTSPEASRQLNRLLVVNLIRKDSDGYYSLTPFGDLVVSCIPNIEAIAKNSDFYLDHDTSPIPPHLLQRMDCLSNGEILRGVFVLVNRMTNLFDEIQEYSYYLSDDFPRFYLPAIEKKLEKGVKFRAIYPKILLDELWAEIDPGIRSRIDFRMLNDVRLVVNITDRFSVIAFPGFDGKIDRDLAIIGHDEDFRKWCSEIFEHYWEKAIPYYGNRAKK